MLKGLIERNVNREKNKKKRWKDSEDALTSLEPSTRVRYILVFISTASYISEFLWYKNPGGPDAPTTGPWEVGHVISYDDCDTFFEETYLTVDGVEYNVFFTTAYFHNKLAVHWNREGLWDNSTQVGTCGKIVEYLEENANQKRVSGVTTIVE